MLDKWIEMVDEQIGSWESLSRHKAIPNAELWKQKAEDFKKLKKYLQEESNKSKEKSCPPDLLSPYLEGETAKAYREGAQARYCGKDLESSPYRELLYDKSEPLAKKIPLYDAWVAGWDHLNHLGAVVPNLRKIVEQYRKELRIRLSASELKEIDKRNKELGRDPAMADHDFLDADYLMYKSFEEILGPKVADRCKDDKDFWNEIWEAVKLIGLSEDLLQ